jgi:glycyl-tRNA synthetase
MYKFPHGTEELEGIANRTDFDLGSHSKNQSELNISSNTQENTDSNAKLAVQDIETKEWVVPYVIEPSAGVDRGFLAILNEAYSKEVLEDGKERVVLSFKPHLSPIKAAIIPLKRNNEELVELAKNIKNSLQALQLGRVVVENSGNIGKSYRRHDEIGTPLCITVDFESLEDGTVTVRDRDSMEQQRMASSDLAEYFKNYLIF